MPQFEYKFKVTAVNDETAKKIMVALSKLVKNVKADDLTMLADKIEANPGLIDTAKKFL